MVCDKSLRHSEYTHHKSELVERVLRWREANPEKFKVQRKIAAENVIKNLAGYYVAYGLSKQIGLPVREITTEMIEAKREQILLHRALCALKKEIKNGSND